MASKKKRIYVLIVFLFFIAYFLLAARSVPNETILSPVWISSLDTGTSVSLSKDSFSSTAWNRQLLPFILGERFGYVDSSGQFSINRVKDGEIYLSENMWVEHKAEPSGIDSGSLRTAGSMPLEIKNISNETIISIDDARGYPVLLDNRVFILGVDMNSLAEIGYDGSILWTYEFGAPLTCIDAAAGLVLTGSLDGIVEILDSSGNRAYYFEPGGSRLNVLLGCAISRNGSRIGIISGIDRQRFILLERLNGTGSDYRTVYHEFLETGFRRPVLISFIDEDRRIVFEREGGLGCYNIRSRRSIMIPLEGEITVIDAYGDQGLLFLITSGTSQEWLTDRRKELIGIRFSQDRNFFNFRADEMQGTVFMRAPFKSNNVYLGRTDSMLIIGGGTALISFHLEEK